MAVLSAPGRKKRNPFLASRGAYVFACLSMPLFFLTTSSSGLSVRKWVGCLLLLPFSTRASLGTTLSSPNTCHTYIVPSRVLLPSIASKALTFAPKLNKTKNHCRRLLFWLCSNNKRSIRRSRSARRTQGTINLVTFYATH